MTKEQFLEKYGEVKVVFSSYYKFSFTFSAELDSGEKISVVVGGDADDIYRFEVAAGCEKTINDLDPYAGSVYVDGNCTEDFMSID